MLVVGVGLKMLVVQLSIVSRMARLVSEEMDSILEDDRFSKIATDKRFRGGGKKQQKVKIDRRFQSMFKDKQFVSKCTVDKRGRPQSYTSSENYRRYYDLDSSDDSDDSGDESDTSRDEDSASEPEEEEGSKLELDPLIKVPTRCKL